MRKYVVWLLLVLYTLVMSIVYIPKITEKYESPEQQANVKAEKVQRMYSEQRDKLVEENRFYVNRQQNLIALNKATDNEYQQVTQENMEEVRDTLFRNELSEGFVYGMKVVLILCNLCVFFLVIQYLLSLRKIKKK